MKQRLGPPKHRKCEAVTGRSYMTCWVRGGREHFLAECWWTPPPDDENCANADWVNYKTGEWRPMIREGKFCR